MADDSTVTHGTSANLKDSELFDMVKALAHKRDRRGDFLNPEMFSDPKWDILLELTAAKFEGVPVPVSSACVATRLPLSTALRHIRALVADGLLKRWGDPNDKRRDLLELADSTMDSMRQYLSAIRP